MGHQNIQAISSGAKIVKFHILYSIWFTRQPKEIVSKSEKKVVTRHQTYKVFPVVIE